MFSKLAYDIFWESILRYHIADDVNQPFENPYDSKTIEHLLYRKNWIDTVQWHYEDIIRDPEIESQRSTPTQAKNRRFQPRPHRYSRVYR